MTIDERSLSLSEGDPEEIAESRPLQLMQAGFPWSREVYAALTEKLMAAGARLVIFDLLFPTLPEKVTAFVERFTGASGKDCSRQLPSKIPTPRTAALMHQWWFPTRELREAVKGNWGMVNLPMWRDNKVRSLYTAATASNIIGVPSLLHEEVPFPHCHGHCASLGSQRSRESEHEPLRFRYSLPGTRVWFPSFEIFVPDFGSQITVTERFSRTGSFLSGQRPSVCMTFILPLGQALRSGNQSACPRGHASQAAGSSKAGLATTVVAIIFAALAAVALTFFLRGRRNGWWPESRAERSSGSACVQRLFASFPFSSCGSPC